jgi:hypothetical protein
VAGGICPKQGGICALTFADDIAWGVRGEGRGQMEVSDTDISQMGNCGGVEGRGRYVARRKQVEGQAGRHAGRQAGRQAGK